MKKKSPQVKLPKQKLFLLIFIVAAAGLGMLFFSIRLAPSVRSKSTRQTQSEQRAGDPSSAPSKPGEQKRLPAQPAKPVQPSSEPADHAQPEKAAPPAKSGEGSGNVPQKPAKPAEQTQQEKGKTKEPAGHKKNDTPAKPETKPGTQSVPGTKPSSGLPPVQAKKSGKLIFVFDDAGNSLKQTLPFLELPFPITVSVLPALADSKKTADAVRNAKKEVFLHQPMQAVNLSINPGPSSIQPDMTTGEAARILRKNIAEIGPIAGMNNHEGSLITADRKLIGAVLDVCIDEKIIFLDSRTSSQTQAPLAAMERGMHIWERDVFLDNSPDVTEMKAMIKRGLAIADKKGYAVMIGHVQTPALAKLLREMYADLRAQGYVFTTLSRMERERGANR